jgi:lipopolysaccharide export system permease protein
VLLQVPSHLYELLPITVLIGTVFVMARWRRSREFTILRTSGLGPLRARTMLMAWGWCFVLVTFACGDYVAPGPTVPVQFLQGPYLGEVTVGQTGAWLRKSRNSSYAVNVGALSADGSMRRVRIIEFDNPTAAAV